MAHEAHLFCPLAKKMQKYKTFADPANMGLTWYGQSLLDKYAGDMPNPFTEVSGLGDKIQLDMKFTDKSEAAWITCDGREECPFAETKLGDLGGVGVCTGIGIIAIAIPQFDYTLRANRPTTIEVDQILCAPVTTVLDMRPHENGDDADLVLRR